MGLFGLSTAEALIIAQREKNSAENYRRRQELNLESKRYQAEQKHNEEQIKLEKEKLAQIGAEARQLEPFITLSAFDQWPEETILIRPSDIKIMNGKTEEYKKYDYNHYGPGGYYYETENKPYTEIQLWDGRKLKVKESVQDIQNKVNETIERMINIQARILSETLKN